MTFTPKFSDIESAARVLDGVSVRTPLLRSSHLDSLCDAQIFLKPECLQHTGSFKFRGAYNAVSNLPIDRESKGIIASSSGNHAQGVAEASRLFGAPASIIMPTDAPKIKIARTRRSGATIIPYDRNEDRDAILTSEAEKTGSYPIHPFEDPYVISGQGTVGLEIAQDLSALGLSCDYLLAPTGGGGLISGISLAMNHYFPDCLIHPVEPKNYDDYTRSLMAGERLSVESGTPKSVCDSIVTPTPGELSFSLARNLLSYGIVLSDSDSLLAVSYAFRELKLVVEPGGAIALAALLSGALKVSGKVVVVVLSGGNIDSSMLSRALAME